MYRILSKFDRFKFILFSLMIITFFFQKPLWCARRGSAISEDCNVDSEGNIYNVSAIVQLPKRFLDYSAFISYGCQFLLITGDIAMVMFIGGIAYKFRVFSMAVLLGVEIAINIMILWRLIPQYNIAPFFKIVFMILYSGKMRNAMKRFFASVSTSYEAILTYIINLLIWSGVAFVLFYDQPTFRDSPRFYTFSFLSYSSSVFTLYTLLTKVNHPDIFLSVSSSLEWAPVFFSLFTFSSIFLVINIVVSIFYISYKRNYSLIIDELGSFRGVGRDGYARIIRLCTNKHQKNEDEAQQQEGLVDIARAKRIAKEWLEIVAQGRQQEENIEADSKKQGNEVLQYVLAKEMQRIAESKKEEKLLAEGVREVGCNQP